VTFGVIEDVLDEHPELRAPVSDVVLAHHLCAEEAQHADQRVTDERGAQMTDVHLLGDVRRRVVHHRGLRRLRLRNA
jgi:hypothetical protein